MISIAGFSGTCTTRESLPACIFIQPAHQSDRAFGLQSDTQPGAPYAPFLEGGLSYVDSAFQWGARR